MDTVAFFINSFVWKPGVSQGLPPFTIVEGTILNFEKHFNVIFGEYLHTYEGTYNTMNLQTIGALALDLFGNISTGWYVVSATTV